MDQGQHVRKSVKLLTHKTLLQILLVRLLMTFKAPIGDELQKNYATKLPPLRKGV